MTTLLRIDASARTKGSHSRKLADYYFEQWQTNNPSGMLVMRDLARDPVPHLNNDAINDFQSETKNSQSAKISEQLISELMNADQVVIASPVYNLTLPSSLKAYFDHVVRFGITFKETDGDIKGCLTGKKAVILTISGHPLKDNAQFDHQSHYLKDVLGYIGFTEIEVVTLEGTALDDKVREQYRVKAEEKIDQLFNRVKEPQWLEQFTTQEKDDIMTLRAAQSKAIIQGDAHAYMALCTDDIQLLIPGHDIVIGRENFLKVESKLFAGNNFLSFDKFPVKIERFGALVVESGRQNITMSSDNAASACDGVFSANQKYMHLFQLTSNGWRFCSLMSNPS